MFVWLKGVKVFLTKISNHCELAYRYLRNKPILFEFVGKMEGEVVGEEIPVVHLTLHDMQHHACIGELTKHVLATGQKGVINAFRIVKFEKIPNTEMLACTTIQPCYK
jgi:hypothetical protein